jgi:hypothetical protein
MSPCFQAIPGDHATNEMINVRVREPNGTHNYSTVSSEQFWRIHACNSKETSLRADHVSKQQTRIDESQSPHG